MKAGKALTLSPFKSKLLKPCRKFIQIFKIRFKKPLFIRSLQYRRHRTAAEGKKSRRKRLGSLLSSFLGKSKELQEMNGVGRVTMSMAEVGREGVLFPSPLTPAYIRASKARKREASGNDDVEDACRSFENYLVEMIVEEGKVSDLLDAEELLYCWKNLNCPVFIDLVCRFYGELCKDLFSGEEEGEESDTPKS